jgi:RNA ligase
MGRELPDEFWSDFDDIARVLRAQANAIEARVASGAASVAHLSEKELGLSLGTIPPDVRPFVFEFRKSGGIDGRLRPALMRAICPSGNELAGYTASYAMGRSMDEAG